MISNNVELPRSPIARGRLSGDAELRCGVPASGEKYSREACHMSRGEVGERSPPSPDQDLMNHRRPSVAIDQTEPTLIVPVGPAD